MQEEAAWVAMGGMAARRAMGPMEARVAGAVTAEMEKMEVQAEMVGTAVLAGPGVIAWEAQLRVGGEHG